MTHCDTLRYMDPIRVSATKQLYQGQMYYLCGRYFQRAGVRLHRKVWADHHPDQELPSGRGEWDVHHLDHDRSNNSVANLGLWSRRDHMAHHHAGQISEARSAAWTASADALAAGNAAISSEDRGDAARRGWATVTATESRCEVCSKVMRVVFGSRKRFCGGTCRARARRARSR